MSVCQRVQGNASLFSEMVYVHHVCFFSFVYPRAQALVYVKHSAPSFHLLSSLAISHCPPLEAERQEELGWAGLGGPF